MYTTEVRGKATKIKISTLLIMLHQQTLITQVHTNITQFTNSKIAILLVLFFSQQIYGERISVNLY